MFICPHLGVDDAASVKGAQKATLFYMLSVNLGLVLFVLVKRRLLKLAADLVKRLIKSHIFIKQPVNGWKHFLCVLIEVTVFPFLCRLLFLVLHTLQLHHPGRCLCFQVS